MNDVALKLLSPLLALRTIRRLGTTKSHKKKLRFSFGKCSFCRFFGEKMDISWHQKEV